MTAPVQSGGAWSVTASPLSEGPHRVVMSVSDAAGNPAGATQTLTIDTVSPVVAIDGGSSVTTSDPTPTISGTSDVVAGTIVRVGVDAQARSAVVESDGTWNVTPTLLSDGTRTLTAAVSDPAGNESSDDQQLTVDTAAPAVTIAGGASALTTDTTPTISGTTDVEVPGVVSVTIDGETLHANPSGGEWSVTAPILANDTYPVVASVTDGAGNAGSAGQQLTIDTALPVITIDGGPSVTTNDPTPTISGTSDVAAGTIVRVTVGAQTRSALVESDGTWNVTPTLLSDGTRTVTAAVSGPSRQCGQRYADPHDRDSRPCGDADADPTQPRPRRPRRLLERTARPP